MKTDKTEIENEIEELKSENVRLEEILEDICEDDDIEYIRMTTEHIYDNEDEIERLENLLENLK